MRTELKWLDIVCLYLFFDVIRKCCEEDIGVLDDVMKFLEVSSQMTKKINRSEYLFLETGRMKYVIEVNMRKPCHHQLIRRRFHTQLIQPQFDCEFCLFYVENFIHLFQIIKCMNLYIL